MEGGSLCYQNSQGIKAWKKETKCIGEKKDLEMNERTRKEGECERRGGREIGRVSR